MRGLAKADMREDAEIWRNDGYGWELLTPTKCSLRMRLNQPAAGDPTDASAASSEFMEIHLPTDSPVRIGDHVRVPALGFEWTVGLSNRDDSYQTFTRTYAARPIAATPRVWVTFVRFNHSTGNHEQQPPQLVQLAWSRNQPDRLGGVAVRQFGFLFSTEDAEDNLNIRQGDTFFYGGMSATVTWVPPDPTQRTEAIFSVNVGEGT
jgi:hypothetical protein